MASSSTFLIASFAILSLFSLASSIQEQSFHNAAEILSDSGYTSMALTLQLVYPALISNASTATIFSPSDDAFSNSGQPSLALLQIHLSPVAYSFDELQFLPFGSKIPTLSPGHSLTVTTRPSDSSISIDYVRIDRSPIYNDGMLVVFTTDDFFDLDFKIPPPAPSPSPSLETAPFMRAPSPIVHTDSSSFAPVLSPGLEREQFSPVSSPRLSPVCSPNLECPAKSGDRSFAKGGKSMRSESLICSLVCIMVMESLFLGFSG